MGELYHFNTFRVSRLLQTFCRGASSLDPLCNNYVGKAVCNVRSCISVPHFSTLCLCVCQHTKPITSTSFGVVVVVFFFFCNSIVVLRRIPTVQHKACTDKNTTSQTNCFAVFIYGYYLLDAINCSSSEAVATRLPSRTTTGTRHCARSSDLCLFPDRLFCLSDIQTSPPCM